MICKFNRYQYHLDRWGNQGLVQTEQHLHMHVILLYLYYTRKDVLSYSVILETRRYNFQNFKRRKNKKKYI